MNTKHEEPTGPAADIPVLLKIDRYFIPQQQVRSVTRFGKGCKVMLTTGEELLVRINYDKVAQLINS